MSCIHYLARDTCQVCRPPDLGTIAMLNEKGDTKYTWDRNNPRECEAAHEHFEAMRKKGFLVFKVRSFGRKSKTQVEAFNPADGAYVYAEGQTEVAREFDPKANYVATPMVRGG